ncbi:hypothetical protein [Ponticoccus litoralis]|uniref:hypothetical protein n=1 Tax=Ponticoccus litoralis TaxID=422297 RepID=UPI003D2F0491
MHHPRCRRHRAGGHRGRVLPLAGTRKAGKRRRNDLCPSGQLQRGAPAWIQVAMLAEEATKTGAVTYATIVRDYANGQDAIAAFSEDLTRLKPEVASVAKQWPALFNIDAGAEAQAIERAKPDAI